MIAIVDPLHGLANMLGHQFIRYGFLAGTAVAVIAGLVGYFVVLRAQVFTVDALSHVAFTGAVGALAFGFGARLGLFVATVGVALLLGLLGPRGRAGDVVIGGVFAWVLGLGVLFLSIFTTSRATGNSAAGVNALFGSIFGLRRHDVVIAVVVAVGMLAVLLAIARPLLFATLDEGVAASRGVPVKALGLVLLVLVGLTAAEATPVVGALLLLGLIAGPAATATKLTDQPYRALVLSPVLAVASVWAGLTISYAVPRCPPSFSIIAVVTLLYTAVAVARGQREGQGLRATMSQADESRSTPPGVA